jgi:rfaE bifunctional protein nucleotidyltransferase chain/domain
VPGCRLVTPNEAELAGLAGARRSSPPERARRFAVLAQHAQQLRRRWRAGAVAVTLGADGALLSHADATPLVVPVPARTDGDSCGAGDQFAGAAALALARGALVSEAVEAAVAAATGYVAAGAADALRGDRRPAATAGGGADGEAGGGTDSEAGGGRTPGPGARLGTRATGELVAAVRARGGTVVATGGCFDLLHAGHVATLQAARGLGDCLVVCVNSDRSVAHLKGPARPLVSQHDRVHLLAALGCVDAVVVFDEATPEAVLSWLRPDIWAKGGDYAGGTPDPADLPEAGAVRRWGGQAVVVPYLAGRSTTGMIAAARDDGRHAPAAGDRRSRAPRLPDGHPAKGA